MVIDFFTTCLLYSSGSVKWEEPVRTLETSDPFAAAEKTGAEGFSGDIIIFKCFFRRKFPGARTAVFL
jgi:hypothetical protein